MAFAIMRFEKLKTGVPIHGSVSHITRSRPTPNADPKRRHLNRSIIGPDDNDPAGVQAAIEARTPAKFRKDAVRVLEFLITATPEWFQANGSQTETYFDSAVEWLRHEFGAENVVSVVQHNDESTPHMHALIVPVDPETGRLNAKRWVGGRGKLRQMQSEFADWQSAFGVERGKPRPGRKHTRVKDWYDGHARLDKREASLQERELAVQAGRETATADRRAAEQALTDAKAERAAFEKRLKAATTEVEAWSEELEGREEVLKQREANQARSLEQREQSLQKHQSTIEQREAAVAVQEQRLRILERELAKRGDRLSTEEGALERRQTEIDAAGEKLRERLDAVRAWTDQHHPEDAELLEGQPRPLPGALRRMVSDAAADWHDHGLDDLPKPPPRRNEPSGPTF